MTLENAKAELEKFVKLKTTMRPAFVQPLLDAKEVVRCKDCKHNYHNMIPDGEAEYGCTKCIELPITAYFYCAWGERREDE